jgi:hypothetical protein
MWVKNSLSIQESTNAEINQYMSEKTIQGITPVLWILYLTYNRRDEGSNRVSSKIIIVNGV